MSKKTYIALFSALVFLFTNIPVFAQSEVVPILLYHCVVDGSIDEDPNVFISRETFTSHMQALKDDGYTPLSFSDYEAYRDGRQELPQKPILITFDDGYLNNYEIAFPILKDFGFKATIFIVTSTVDNRILPYPHFSWQQAKEMSDSGLIGIESHGHGHVSTPSLSPSQAQLDMRLSKYLIEKNLGINCTVFAYPYGFSNDATVAIAASAGYKIQCLTGEFETNSPTAPITGLKRITINGNLTPRGLLSTIEYSKARAR